MEEVNESREHMVQEMFQRYTESQRQLAEQRKLIEKYAADNSRQYDAINARIEENVRVRDEQHQQEMDEAKQQADKIIRYNAIARKRYLREHRLGWIAMAVSLVDVAFAIGALLYVAHINGMMSIAVAFGIALVTDIACGMGIVHLIRRIAGR